MQLKFLLCNVLIFGIIYAVAAEENDSSTSTVTVSSVIFRVCIQHSTDESLSVQRRFLTQFFMQLFFLIEKKMKK